jgi:RimJ/RimL family protein N-acetyltransferase
VPFANPVTLTGSVVRLSPTTPADAAGLADAAIDGELWQLWYTSVPRPEAMAAHVDWVLAEQAEGRMAPFTTRRLADDRIIGMTTYCNIEGDHRRLEIGHTWNARSVHRSGTNADSKLLLLTHAFEVLDCIAVEFRTHWLNHQSRGAIARLGAKQDGVLRSHRISPDGTLRDTVVFSILAHEWPAARSELRRRIAARAANSG